MSLETWMKVESELSTSSLYLQINKNHAYMVIEVQIRILCLKLLVETQTEDELCIFKRQWPSVTTTP